MPRRTLTDPSFSIREAVKQLTLLEDHLVHPYKRCNDCIRKHLLSIEAFAEEAVQLGPGTAAAKQGEALAEHARTWLERVSDGQTVEVAADVRRVRKALAGEVADPRLHGLGLGHLWDF